MAIIVRPAQENDLSSVKDINSYYVENTVLTFAKTPKSDVEILGNHQDIMSRGLPYFVAVDESTQAVLGYTYVSPFRSGLAAYVHSVELSLFCHHEHTRKGVGTLLLTRLLEFVRQLGENGKVRQVLAIMAVDETGAKNGLGLKEFYESFGFEEVGHLRKVGRKFDRW